MSRRNMSIETKFNIGEHIVYFKYQVDAPDKIHSILMGKVMSIKVDGQGIRYETESFHSVLEDELCKSTDSIKTFEQIIKEL